MQATVCVNGLQYFAHTFKFGETPDWRQNGVEVCRELLDLFNLMAVPDAEMRQLMSVMLPKLTGATYGSNHLIMASMGKTRDKIKEVLALFT